jgi:hypothetical protein
MENQGHISTSEWKEMLSTAYAELYAILAESGMRYFETEATVTTTGVASYALPAGHLSTVGVDYLVSASTGERRQLEELMAQERNMFTGAGASWASAYALVGSNLVLYATPPTGQTYYHIYVPQPADLSAAADATSVDVVTPDGEGFLTWAVAVMALAKEESDAGLARAEREAARNRVMEWSALRSLNTPRRRVVGPCLYQGDPGDYPWRGDW